MALVDGFLELERSSGKLEWSAILQKMASDLGFSKILFGLLPKDSQDYENAFIVGNYPAAWREHYDRAGYARVDPTVSHCTQSVLPIFWEPSIYQTRKQHEFFEEASAAGLVYGLTMPLHGARGELGALSLSVEAENRAEANRFMESVLPTLWMLKDYALQSGAGLAFEHPVSKPVVLTSREKEVLQWCAIGKTSWEISVICNSRYIGKGRFSPFSKRLPQDWLIPKRLQKVSWLSRRAVRVAFARKAMFWGCVLSCEAIALIFSDVSSSLARVRVHRNLSHLLVIKL